ncbi:hyaluronoglucosaminidase [Teladorsagia circumcincta]|uniref:Hyaluronidase n=1 Tax=Teladorsagia circumcincta TaxID=45464 RepID=A0A2G9UB37_TELCI|nr:hyaluronoglucosaminidase [Teladorsagia circumcincta]
MERATNTIDTLSRKLATSDFISEGQTFFGEKIVLFYETKFGLYPYYEDYNSSQPINGGLPQNASLDLHLHEVIKQILIKIPNQWFNGLAVIDFEHWRPLYAMNWDKKRAKDAVEYFIDGTSRACYRRLMNTYSILPSGDLHCISEDDAGTSEKWSIRVM